MGRSHKRLKLVWQEVGGWGKNGIGESEQGRGGLGCGKSKCWQCVRGVKESWEQALEEQV